MVAAAQSWNRKVCRGRHRSRLVVWEWVHELGQQAIEGIGHDCHSTEFEGPRGPRIRRLLSKQRSAKTSLGYFRLPFIRFTNILRSLVSQLRIVLKATIVLLFLLAVRKPRFIWWHGHIRFVYVASIPT